MGQTKRFTQRPQRAIGLSQQPGGGTRYYEDEILIGGNYVNQELCDLRSVFIQQGLLKEPRFKDCPPNVRIVKGEETPRVSPLDRNVTILLFINWDIINQKLRSQGPGKPYSPFHAKP